MLPAERAKASFNSRAFTELLWGGKDALAQREKWMELFDKKPIFDNKDDYFHERS